MTGRFVINEDAFRGRHCRDVYHDFDLHVPLNLSSSIIFNYLLDIHVSYFPPVPIKFRANVNFDYALIAQRD